MLVGMASRPLTLAHYDFHAGMNVSQSSRSVRMDRMHYEHVADLSQSLRMALMLVGMGRTPLTLAWQGPYASRIVLRRSHSLAMASMH